MESDAYQREKRRVCWATPKETDKISYDYYSLQIGKMKIPYEMMKCKYTSPWFGFGKWTDCFLEI